MAFISYQESIKNLHESLTAATKTEQCFISDALNRVLACDIIADHNSPMYPTSAMDGYAVRHEDLSSRRIKIAGNLPAGSFNDHTLEPGTCIKTFTGSLITPGADTLIPIENVTVDGDEIIINIPVDHGFSVRPIGENYSEGETLIAKGTTISYAEIGVLASLNISQIEVFQRPRIAIIATGSEILDVGEKQSNPSQIRSSNQFTLEALAKKAGADTTRAPLSRDDKETIENRIKDALNTHDIIVTTGGVSVGDYDFVKDIIAGFDPEYITEGVKIKPGQHIKLVKIGHKYICALPGFPYSSTVTFMLYVIPLIFAMQGKAPLLPTITARLQTPYKKRSNKTEFAVANLHYVDGEYRVDFDGMKSGSSAILTNMLGSVGLVNIPEDREFIDMGEMVEVINLTAL